MATKTVNAGTEGGFINNVSGIYVASNEGFYISSTSSSADANENEAHIWVDTTDANTGLVAGDTVTKVELTIQVTAYSNPGPDVNWVHLWGTGAGATFDAGDWRVDSNDSGTFDPGATGAYTVQIATTLTRNANYHIRIKAQSGGNTANPSGSITFSYSTRPYLTITYTPTATTKQLAALGVGQ